VQDSISEQVARALLVNISRDEKYRLTKRYTENVTAYNLYLKGRHFWNMRTPDGLHRSIDYFNQAIAVDSNYALAYAGLADSYALLSGYGILSPTEGFPKARVAALRALQMDEELAEAHTSLAFVSIGYDKDWATAGREYKRATELNSNYITAHHWFAEFLSALGRHDEAIAEIRRAIEIDPVSPIVNADAGEILCFARRYDEAIAQLKNTLELEPNFIQAHRFLALAYLQKGMHEESIAELKRAVEISNRNSVILALLGHSYASSGNKHQAEKILEELKALSTKQYVSPHEFGVIYIGLGDHDRAFEFLRKAVEQRTGTLAFIKVNPVYDKLRSDSRFTELLQQLNFF
jgi:tetratricopeptide (TPR) repeat protein